MANPSSKKDILSFIAWGLSAIFFVLALILAIFLAYKMAKKSDIQPKTEIEKPNIRKFLTQKEVKKSSHASSKIEQMIKKANALYKGGQTQKALKLFVQINDYSQSISFYNLGVTLMKENKRKDAIEAFLKAYANHQNATESLLNAAVCALFLNNQKQFEEYLLKASKSIVDEFDSPLLTYYFALLNYYKKNYLEALIVLENDRSKYYKEQKSYIKAKIYTMLNQNLKAIVELEKIDSEEDSLALGQLYARIGDLNLANKYFEEAITLDLSPVKAKLSQAFAMLKNRQIRPASKIFQKLLQKKGDKIAHIYPIEVTLKRSLFDPNYGSVRLRNSLQQDIKMQFSVLFYFAPFMLFDSEEVVHYIKKGGVNIIFNQTSKAYDNLSKSHKDAQYNKIVASALEKIEQGLLVEGHNILKNALKFNPSHSVFRYNLALSYAKIGDFQNAYEEFLRAYNLDNKNYLAGLFAIATARLTNKNFKKFNQLLKENLQSEPPSNQNDLYLSMFNFFSGLEKPRLDLLQHISAKDSLNLAYAFVGAFAINESELYRQRIKELKQRQKDDLLVGLLYEFIQNKDNSLKQFNRAVLDFINRKKVSVKQLYRAPWVARELFVRFAVITGTIGKLQKTVEREYQMVDAKTVQITQLLALVSLYAQKFEQSYTLYNELIDKYNTKEVNTLFCAALAAIGSKHLDSAIALLETVNLKNRLFYESRYALGLIYMQIFNYNGAVIQFSRINSNTFISKYFNFNIVNTSSSL